MSRKRKRHPLLENLEVIDINSKGKAVARSENMVVFLKGAVPGDIVDVQVYKKRRSYSEGNVVKLHKKSDLRTEPFCEHFGICGGCSWQNLEYKSQLEYKQKVVVENLKKLGGVVPKVVLPILPSENQTHYRNKLEFTFSNSRWLTEDEIESQEEFEEGDRSALGFHIPGRFDKVLDINECHLQADPSNAIRLCIKEFAIKNNMSFFDLRNHNGLLRNLIIRITTTGELMVIVSFFKEKLKDINGLLEHLYDKFPKITSLMYVINPKKNDTISDLKIRMFLGKDHITEEINGLKFKIGPKTFFQTNSKQAENLFKTVLDFAEFSGDELVYDLYTGSGSIANLIASSVKKVIGLEYIPEAIEDAKANSDQNNISNTSYFAGDIKDLLNAEFIEKNGVPDVIITDPPRVGMHKNVVKAIIEASPKKVIYVSCNSATQARDLELLSEKYTVEKIQPIDMFPHTPHVENVALLLPKEDLVK